MDGSETLCKQGVVGSIPTSSTKKNRCGCTGSSLLFAAMSGGDGTGSKATKRHFVATKSWDGALLHRFAATRW